MSDGEAFKKPWWLPGGHCETILAYSLGPRMEYARQQATTPDNDVIVFDSLPGQPDQPGLCIFHGLEGCSQSHSVRQIAAYFSSKGWTVVVPHFRSCGIMNHLPRAYHAGDSKDIDWMIKYASGIMGAVSSSHAIGISLGGNMLAKWLAENPGQQDISSAATVAAPLDLQACAARLDRWFNRRLYGRYFLNSLKNKIYMKLKRYPFLIKPRVLERISTLREFDEHYTAPIHGFAGATDYYARSSALPMLHAVASPLLCLHADNDALVPVPKTSNKSSSVMFECTRAGGHAGFVSSPFPGNTSWLPNRIERFFNHA